MGGSVTMIVVLGCERMDDDAMKGCGDGVATASVVELGFSAAMRRDGVTPEAAAVATSIILAQPLNPFVVLSMQPITFRNAR